MATTDLKLEEPGSLPKPGPIGRFVRFAFGAIGRPPTLFLSLTGQVIQNA